MTDQMLIADAHEEIAELKRQLKEANAYNEALKNTIINLGFDGVSILKEPGNRLALHDAEVIEKAIKECSHKYDEYSWDNILGYAQQLRDSVKEGE